MFFFFKETAPTEIYTLSLHDALPIFSSAQTGTGRSTPASASSALAGSGCSTRAKPASAQALRCEADRKSTRLNSSHANISYAVFCLKKKTTLYHLDHAPLQIVICSHY